MEIPCVNCGTKINMDAAMCYACGAKNDNPFNFDAAQIVLYANASNAMENGDFAQAISFYDKLIEARPKLSHLWVCKAIAFSMSDNKTEAWNCYSRAIEIDPINPEPWQTRFEFLVEDYRQMRDFHIEDYFRQFGKGNEPLTNMAETIILLSPGDIDMAIGYLEAVLNPNPKEKRAKKLLKKANKIKKKAK